MYTYRLPVVRLMRVCEGVTVGLTAEVHNGMTIVDDLLYCIGDAFCEAGVIYDDATTTVPADYFDEVMVACIETFTGADARFGEYRARRGDLLKAVRQVVAEEAVAHRGLHVVLHNGTADLP